MVPEIWPWLTWLHGAQQEWSQLDMFSMFWKRFLPSVSGRVLEFEGWEVRFLRLNPGRTREALDLLIYTARESGTEALLIIEQYNLSEIVPSTNTYCETCWHNRDIPETGPKFLHSPVRRALHSRVSKESRQEAQSQHGSGDRSGAKRNPKRGDSSIPENLLGSPQLLFWGGMVFCDVKNAVWDSLCKRKRWQSE